MKLLRWLCCLRVHRWRGEADSLAPRYRHNTWWDKTNNRLDAPRALVQTCTRCGRQRAWSFNRGGWREHVAEEAVSTGAAWAVDGAMKQSTDVPATPSAASLAQGAAAPAVRGAAVTPPRNPLEQLMTEQ